MGLLLRLRSRNFHSLPARAGAPDNGLHPIRKEDSMTAPNSKMTTTSVTVISPSLADLEAEFAATLKNDLPNVIRRGELLLQIKQALKRGKWLPWLANKFALSESTA